MSLVTMRVFTVVSVFAASISAAAIEGYRNSYNGTLDNHNPSHLRPPPSVQGRSPPTNDTHKGIIPSHERPPLSSRDDLPPTDRPHKVFIPSHLRPPLSDKNLSPNYTLEELSNQTGLTFLPFGTEDDPHTRVFDEESGARQRRGMKQKRGDITVRHDPVCNRLAAPNKIGDGWKGALQLAELLDRWEPGNEWQDSFSIWMVSLVYIFALGFGRYVAWDDVAVAQRCRSFGTTGSDRRLAPASHGTTYLLTRPPASTFYPSV